MSGGEWLSFLIFSVQELRVVEKQDQNMDAIHVYSQPGKRGRISLAHSLAHVMGEHRRKGE